MTFEEVLPALKKGKRIKRKSWSENWRLRESKYIYVDEIMSIVKVREEDIDGSGCNRPIALNWASIKADDWEVVS
jgi:hypothetical protein